MKKIFLIIGIVLIGIQFIRPSKNDTTEISKNHIQNVPSNIQKILKTSCNDCHSNHTVYPWYNDIAPVSWFLASHINDGKEHLNFDTWTAYNEHQKEHIIKDLKKVIKKNQMPLSSYTIIHKNAVLTDKDKKDLLEWINTLK